jgi:hypothetical protein
MFAALLPVLGGLFQTVANNLFPDPKDELQRMKMQQELQLALMQQSAAIEQAAANIVNTEAGSSHWLAANWRPITMLTFLALIVARFFGWTAPNISEPEYIKLWELVQIGLGGYVVGRSVEKIAPAIADVLKKK